MTANSLLYTSMDTQLQKFVVEAINKESSLRCAWQLRYSKKFAKQALESPPKKSRKAGLTFNTTVEDKIKQIENKKRNYQTLPTKLVASADHDQQTTKDLSDRLSKSDGAMSLKGMRPASKKTRALLFDGISSHEEGRYAYLKSRKQKIPEDKYEFPILSSTQYGWKIKEYSNPKSSPHARTCIIKDSFYRSSGVSF